MEANLHPNELYLLYFFTENCIWIEYLLLGTVHLQQSAERTDILMS